MYKRQEKLLELYKEIASIRDDLIDYLLDYDVYLNYDVYSNDDFLEMKQMDTILEKQIKEIENE